MSHSAKAIGNYFIGAARRGSGHRDGWFRLSDSTLIALITTTASVPGLFTIVANHLFRTR